MRGIQKSRYFLVYEVAFLSLMAALVYVFKTFFKTPIQLPGHTAIFWVIPFIIGIGLTRKFGVGTYIGVLSGLLIGFVGMADTGLLKVFEYTAMGFTMDVLALLFRGHLTNPLVGFVLGAFGSFAKMIVNYSITSALSVNANILLVGIGVAGASHLIFGGAGGVISGIILNRIRHVQFPNQIAKQQKNSKIEKKEVGG
jgi:hypothetical protein